MRKGENLSTQRPPAGKLWQGVFWYTVFYGNESSLIKFLVFLDKSTVFREKRGHFRFIPTVLFKFHGIQQLIRSIPCFGIVLPLPLVTRLTLIDGRLHFLRQRTIMDLLRCA